MDGFVSSHMPCPCGESKDAYAIRADGSGKCFSGKCGGKNFFPKEYRPEECVPGPFGRGVKDDFAKHLGFEGLVHPKSGTLAFHVYRYPNGVEKFRRVHDKNFFWKIPDGVERPALGGIGLYDMPPSKTCVLVEGEVDAASAYQMLNTGMANETPVYWLLSAGIAVKDRQKIFDELNKYDRVVFAHDNDEAGRKSVEVIGTLLPQKLRLATLNKFKDPNEYLVNGAEKEFKRSVANYSRYTPEYIFNGLARLEAIWDDVEQEKYIPTPFSGLNEKIKGIPFGHVVLISGQEGLGKTELLRALEYQVLFNNPSDKKDALSVTHFEENAKVILRGYGCYDQNRNFRDPDVTFTFRDIRPTLEKIDERLFITDFYKARDEMSVKSFMEKVEYLHYVCGVTVFSIDPINQLRPDAPEEPLVKFLDGLAMEMARFCKDTGCACMWTAHETDDGKTRDSRMIAKACSIRIEVTRDPDSFDPVERNSTKLRVTKNRPFSLTGDAGFVTFDPSTFTLTDPVEVDLTDKLARKSKGEDDGYDAF